MNQSRPPIFVPIAGVAAVAMLVPALVGYGTGDVHSGQMFIQAAALLGLAVGLVGITMAERGRVETVRGQLLTLLAAYAVLPLALAVPHRMVVPDATFTGAWFEMISAITTTGAVIYDSAETVPLAAHVWRATVAWLGGLMAWVTAIALLAPMNIGGFEVRAPLLHSLRAAGNDPLRGSIDPFARLIRFTRLLVPVYTSLTALAWIALLAAGEDQITALCHAMAALSTSGLSPIGGLGAGSAGLMAEVIVLGALVFALSRTTFARIQLGETRLTPLNDSELRLGIGLIVGVALLLFARHWIGSGEGSELTESWASALWGNVFTVASFLTTAGFVSSTWDSAASWSGLTTPGMALMGVAIFGGGVATTAGGVKLLRVYALSRHMQRELQRLVMPSSVGGDGRAARRMRKQGAIIAWIFFMLFALSIAAVTTTLTLIGLGFEEAMILTIAALTTCGPLVQVAGEFPLYYDTLPPAARAILGAAMVTGRLESLAIVALLNIDLWRR